MKSIVYCIYFCFASVGISQNSLEDITGSYYIPSGNPEGGTTIVVMPQNIFVVFYFGGMRKGTWETKEDHYKFTYHVEPKFVLYARNNPSVKDSVSVRFAVDGDKQVALRFNALKNQSFTPLFNKDANCFEYPYIIKQKEAIKSVDVCVPDTRYYRKGELSSPLSVYNFKTEENYNDFIIVDLPREYTTTREFTALFNNNALVLKDTEVIKKRGNYKDLNKQDLAYIKRFTENEILPERLEYGNEFFPQYDTPTKTDVMPYIRIESVVTAVNKIEVGEKSLFFTTCDD